jgi:hypothetical protein
MSSDEHFTWASRAFHVEDHIPSTGDISYKSYFSASKTIIGNQRYSWQPLSMARKTILSTMLDQTQYFTRSPEELLVEEESLPEEMLVKEESLLRESEFNSDLAFAQIISFMMVAMFIVREMHSFIKFTVVVACSLGRRSADISFPMVTVAYFMAFVSYLNMPYLVLLVSIINVCEAQTPMDCVKDSLALVFLLDLDSILQPFVDPDSEEGAKMFTFKAQIKHKSEQSWPVVGIIFIPCARELDMS